MTAVANLTLALERERGESVPDHDLGTAHGRVEIDADVDIDKARRQLESFRDKIRDLERRLNPAINTLEKFRSTLEKVRSTANSAAFSLANFARVMRSITSEAVKTALAVTGISEAFVDLREGSIAAAKGTLAVSQSLLGLTRVSDLARRRLYNFLGVNQELQKMGPSAQSIVKAAAAFATLNAAISSGPSIHKKLSKRSASWRTATIAVKGYADNIRLLTGLYAASDEASERHVNNILNVVDAVKKHSKEIKSLWDSYGKGLGSISKGIVGLAMFRAGLDRLKNVIGVVAKQWKILAVLWAATAALAPIGTLILGIADALKQLSGALLVLPGAMSALGVVGAVAITAVVGLAKAFKAGFGEAEKFDEAVKGLSPRLQDFARDVKAVKEEYKGFAGEISEAAFGGLMDNFKELAVGYLPLLKAGFTDVAGGLNTATLGLNAFLRDKDSIRDFKQLFQDSARVSENFGQSLRPALDGLRNLGAVGSRVFADWTNGMSAQVHLFDLWMQRLRSDGSLETWIRNGTQGFKDIWTSIRDFSVGVSTLFGHMGSDGSNALERMALAAESFRAKMEGLGSNSNFSKMFSQFNDHVVVVFEQLVSLVKTLAGVLAELAPIANGFAEAFGSGLTDSLSIMGEIVQAATKILTAFQPLIDAAGWILGAALAWKVFKTAMMPVVSLLQMFTGGGMIVSGIRTGLETMSTGLMSAEQKMAKFGDSTTKIRGAMNKAAGGMAALAGAAGPLTVALTAIVAAFIAYGQAQSSINDFNNQQAESAQKATEAYRELAGAIAEAGGGAGAGGTAGVRDAMSNSVQTMRDKWDEEASQRTGATDRAGAIIGDIAHFRSEWEDVDALYKINDVADAAKRAKEAVDEIGWSQEQLTTAVTGTDQEYQGLVNKLKTTEFGGGEAIAQFDAQRAAFKDISASVDRIGPGFIQVGDALKTIADQSASAADKLSAMTQALEGMGLLQVSQAEAFSRVRESIAGITESVSQLQGVTAQDIFNNGKIDLASEGFGKVWSTLRPMSESLRSVAAAGGDVQRAWTEMQPALEQVQQQLGLTDEQMQQLYSKMGLVPDTLTTFVKLEGATEAEQQIWNVYRLLQNAPLNTEIPVKVDSQEAIDTLRGMGMYVEEVNGMTGEVKIKIHSEEERQKLDQYIADMKAKGIDVPFRVDDSELNTAKDKAKEPVEVPVHMKVNDTFFDELKNGTPAANEAEYAKNVGDNFAELARRQKAQRDEIGAGSQASASSSPQTPEQAMPEKVTKQFELQGTDAAIGAVNAVRNALNAMGNPIVKRFELSGTDAAIGAANAVRTAIDAMGGDVVKNFQLSGTDAAIGAANAVNIALQNIPSQTVKNFELSGTDAAIGAINAVVVAIQNLATQVEQAAQRAASAMNSFKSSIDGVKSALDAAAASATSSGQSLGQNFANGIRSKTSEVEAASMALARAAARPLPSSPAEIGPFSGKGWTPHRGRALAEGFAQGIHDGTGTAKLASLNMAMQIAGAMDQIRMAFGMTPTFFDQNRAPGAGGKRYFRDPEISDKTLAEQRKERNEKAAEKAEIDAEKAAEKIPDAEKSVVKAKENLAKAEERAAELRAKANVDPKKEEQAKNAEESLDKARKNLSEREARLLELQSSTANARSDGSAGSGLRPNTNRTDYIAAMTDIASRFNLQMTSGMRDEPGSYHSTGTAADFSNGSGNTDEMLAFANFINDNFKPWTKELIYNDPRFSGKQIGDGKNVPDSYYAGAGDHTNHVHWAVSEAPEWTGAIGKAVTDSVNQGAADGAEKAKPKVADAVSGGVKTIPLIKKADGTYGSSNAAWDHLIQRESGGNFKIVQGIQDANSGGNEASGGFQIAKGTWASNGGLEFAPEARMATPEQQAIIAARIFEKSGGAPWGAGLPGRENEAELRAGITAVGNNTGQIATNTGQTATNTGTGSKSAEDTVAELRANNKKLDQAITTAQDPNSSEGEVIRALQDIDDQMVGMSATERQSLDAIRESAMTDRGIKEYDPFEGAPETPEEWFDTIFNGFAQNFLGLYKTIESGMQGAVDMAHLISRGFSNTKDVNTFIDGVQSLVNTVVEVASTIGSIVQTIASVAAAAGAMIPGIGQVAAVIQGISGGVANINALVDFAQEVAHIGGRWIGKGLSSLLGFLGGTGELQGQIKMLMDMNDNTLKVWSDRNAADKAVIGGSGGQGGTNPNSAPVVGGDLNVYGGPGQDPAETMNQAMFVVNAHSQGVYSG